ncbi:MAG: CPBP family intramembrane glutamic endopeptidase, partial [Planctomycetota bacterium]
ADLGLLAVLIVLSIASLAWLTVRGGLDAVDREGERSRDVAPLSAVGWLIGAGAVWLGHQVAAAFIFSGFSVSLEDDLAVSISLLGSYVVGCGFGIIVVERVSRIAPRAGLRARGRDLWTGPAWLGLSLPVVLLAGLLAAWVNALARGEPPEELSHETLGRIAEGGAALWVWLTVAAVTLGAPLLEEIVYRGLLQSGLRRLTGSPWAAVLVTSVVFAAMHVPALSEGGGYALANLFVLSVFLGVAFERSRSLGVPVLMHAGFNAFNIALVRLG